MSPIVRIFNALHDGWLSDVRREGNDLIFEVDCQYLAQLAGPDSERFFIHVYDPAHAYVILYPSDFTHSTLIKDLLTHEGCRAAVDLDILDAVEEEDFVRIHFDTSSHEGMGFALIRIQAERASVQDDTGAIASVDDLEDLARRYWDRFGK